MPSPLSRTIANNLWKVKAIRFLFWLHFIAAVIVPFFRGWGGLSFTQILFLNGWFMLCNFLLEIPTGNVSKEKARGLCEVIEDIHVSHL